MGSSRNVSVGLTLRSRDLTYRFIHGTKLSLSRDRGQSVIVYHHLDRSGPSTEQVERLQTELDNRMPRRGFTTFKPIIYRTRYPAERTLLKISAAEHRADSSMGTGFLMSLTKWEDHFVNQ